MSKDRRIDIEEVGAVTVVRLLEKKILEETSIDALGQDLFALVDRDGRRKVVLDFKAVEYLSSAAIGRVTSLDKKLKVAQGKLVLCNIRKDIFEVFQLLRLPLVLTICNDLDQAIEKF